MKHADAQVLLELFANQPLAIVPDRLTTLRALVRDAEAVTEEEVRAALGAATSRGARDAPAGVAVIPIIGTIVPRASERQELLFGVVSAERIRGEVAAAVADKSVKHIVLHMDTPGGNVAGTPELARAVFEARGVKPVTAVADSLMASAGYWIGTAASEVVVSPSGEVGSIGVIALHADLHRLFANFGIDITVLREPSTKAEGDPFSPLSDSARDAFQQQLREVYDDFVAAVAEHRGVSPSAVRSGFAQGRTALAKRALAEGMVDRIATLDQVLGEIGDRPARGRARAEADAAPEDARTAAGGAGPAISTAIRAESPFNAVGELIDVLKRHGLAGASPTMPDADEVDAERDVEAAVEAEQQDAATQDEASTETVAAEGAAADAAEDPPTQPAPGASEEAMPEETLDTAARKGAADPAEQARRKEIRALGRDYEIDAETVDNWIDSGATVESVQAEILRRQREADKARTPLRSQGDRVTVQHRWEKDPRRGFGSHREFLMAVVENTGYRTRDAVQDERLRALAVADKEDRAAAGELAFVMPAAFTPSALLGGDIQAAAGSDEQGTYSDRFGGATVPTAMLPQMLTIGWEGDPTLGRTQPIPMAAPMVEIPARVDKDHRESVSGGFVVTRKPETVAGTLSRMETEKVTLRATSVFGLGASSEEVLTDSLISFIAIVEAGFRDQFAFHMLTEKIRGGGGDEYLGVLNSRAKVVVAPEAGQDAGTILAENVVNMRSRCWGYGNAIWLANHDTLPQLIKLAIVVSDGEGAGGLVTIYKQSMEDDRPDMLLGRPIFYHEALSTVGQEGDLILVNWSQYLEGLYQPIQSAESVHVRFVNHERMFKFWLRNAGAPWWNAPLKPHKSADTLSPIVTLQARTD